MPERNFIKDISILRKKLLKWYRSSQRSLPWRAIADPYKIWISEIMLQQTTVKTVIPYYQRWIKAFPDIKNLSKAPMEKVLKAWEGMGYYERARNIHRCAKTVEEKFHGKLPCSYEELLRLPGIGPYTAGAIMSIAFGKRFSILDANVKRFTVRILCIRGKIKNRQEKKIQKFLEELLPRKNVGTFNQALMELGALVCRSKKPLCPICPLSDFCLSYKKGLQEAVPLSKEQDYEQLEAVLAVIKKNGRILIKKRPSCGLMADLWEFPMEKKKEGEKHGEALMRVLKRELGIKTQKVKFLGKVTHSYTRFRVSLYVYFCMLNNNRVYREGSSRKVWVRKSELARYPFTSGSNKVIKLIKG